MRILEDGGPKAYKEGLGRTSTIYNENNTDKIFESAFRLTDTSRSSGGGPAGSSGPNGPNGPVYYLSQFQDSKTPCAANVTRATYTTFVSKSGAKKTVTGHECELIAEAVTKDNVKDQCYVDPRCAGYYTSTSPYLPPVMAATEPGQCKVEWKLLPTADRPTTTDKCKRDMGDLVWFSSGGKCVPTCPTDAFRASDTGMCSVVVPHDSCIKNWGFRYPYWTGPKGYRSCVPASEAACPIGWTYQAPNGEYPYGQCTK